MNKQTAAEFLPLVQALAEGKTIQHLCKDNGQWYDSDPCYFNLPPSDYRIKSEPREFDAWVSCNGLLVSYSMADYPDWKPIRLIEIL